MSGYDTAKLVTEGDRPKKKKKGSSDKKQNKDQNNHGSWGLSQIHDLLD